MLEGGNMEGGGREGGGRPLLPAAACLSVNKNEKTFNQSTRLP